MDQICLDAFVCQKDFAKSETMSPTFIADMFAEQYGATLENDSYEKEFVFWYKDSGLIITYAAMEQIAKFWNYKQVVKHDLQLVHAEFAKMKAKADKRCG